MTVMKKCVREREREREKGGGRERERETKILLAFTLIVNEIEAYPKICTFEI